MPRTPPFQIRLIKTEEEWIAQQAARHGLTRTEYVHALIEHDQRGRGPSPPPGLPKKPRPDAETLSRGAQTGELQAILQPKRHAPTCSCLMCKPPKK